MTRRPAWATLALGLVALSGCCSGVELAVGAYDPRVELEAQTTYALLGPVLQEQPVWAYASSAQVASELAAHYRPLADASWELGSLAEAPAPLRAALQAADEELRALGYRPVDDATADFALALGLTTGEGGALTRVSLDVGRVLDGRFRPDLISLAALVPLEDACLLSAPELVRELVSALPPREPPDE